MLEHPKALSTLFAKYFILILIIKKFISNIKILLKSENLKDITMDNQQGILT